MKAAGDLFHCLLILCTTLPRCEQAPPRWHWQEILVAELMQIGEVSTNELELAMVCCLIMSAATGDKGCIKAVCNLKEKGFLSLEALAKANQGEVELAIKQCGLQRISAKFLIGVSKEVLRRPDKCFPRDYSKMTELSGLGPKATNVLMNEVFKFATGAPTDRHVEAGAVALRLHVSPPWLKTRNVEHTEISLRTWLCITQCKHINPIMGCMAQLFCTRHRAVKESDKEDLHCLMLAVEDHIHNRYHMVVDCFSSH